MEIIPIQHRVNNPSLIAHPYGVELDIIPFNLQRVVWHPNPDKVLKSSTGEHILTPTLQQVQKDNPLTIEEWLESFVSVSAPHLPVIADLKRDEEDEGNRLSDEQKELFLQLPQIFKNAGLTNIIYSAFCPSILEAFRDQSDSNSCWLIVRPELDRGYFSRVQPNEQQTINNFTNPILLKEIQRLVKALELDGLSLCHKLLGLTSIMQAAQEVKSDIQFAFWTVNNHEELNALQNNIQPFNLNKIYIISNHPSQLEKSLS